MLFVTVVITMTDVTFTLFDFEFNVKAGIAVNSLVRLLGKNTVMATAW